MLDRLEEQLVAVPLAGALYREDEVIPSAAELDLALELGVAQTLAADGVLHGVLDDSAHLADVVLEPTARRGILRGDLLQTDDAAREAALELFSVDADDGLHNLDGRQETVRGGGDGRELGVVGANALVHVHRQVDGLLGAHLGDEDVRVDGGDGVGAGKVLFLLAHGDKDNVLGVDVGVVVGLGRVLLVGVGVLVGGARHVELEADGVVVEAAGVLVLGVLGLLVPPEEVLEALAAALERDQAQAVGEHLVLDDRGVVVDEDILNGQRGDLGDEDAAEGVGERGVEADEGEGGVELVVLVKVDREVGREALDCEGCVFAGDVAGVFDGADVGDGFLVDVDGLYGRGRDILAPLHPVLGSCLLRQLRR